uniref:Uncharacterized protein n=1 Tax=Rhizophora mucronata TaxID=61149 RepID=A0A2P2R3T4_RHIMU
MKLPKSTLLNDYVWILTIKIAKICYVCYWQY